MEAISSRATVGPVALNVADIARVADFYQTAIGLRVHRTVDGTVALGAGGKDLLVLHDEPDAVRPLDRSPGLFHTAILVPSRAELGGVLGHLIEQGVQLHGAADHLVSEALYLTDPEGNGIEIYRDRPREQWTYRDGFIHMTTEPLDLDALLDERGPWRGMPEGTVIGHVHLRVADLAAAEKFYREVIGFDLTTRYGGSAAFLSAGGYHHYLGINTWNSLGAPPVPTHSLGLRHFQITVPDEAELEKITKRAGNVEATEAGVRVRDPSGNAVVIVSRN